LRLFLVPVAVLLSGPALAQDCPVEPVASARPCLAKSVEDADRALAIQIERTSRALATARAETLRQFEATIRNFRVFMETDCRVAAQMAAANGYDYEAARLHCTATAIRERVDALKGRL
jgi:hypothetical protein